MCVLRMSCCVCVCDSVCCVEFVVVAVVVCCVWLCVCFGVWVVGLCWCGVFELMCLWSVF